MQTFRESAVRPHSVVLTNDVPVIVLNWNGWDDTMRCLESLAHSREHLLVWVVDNGSELDRSNELRARFPGIRVVHLDENYGWAGGYNRALKLAYEEGFAFAYLLNNDTLVRENFLSPLVGAISDDASLAAVGSVVLYEADPNYVKFDGDHWDLHQRALDGKTCLVESKGVNGAGMLLRLNTCAGTNFFDERYFCYGEEAEWCRRMTRLGWRHGVHHASQILHRSKGSDVNANSVYYMVRNRFLCYQECTRSRRYSEERELILQSLSRVRAFRKSGKNLDQVAAICAAIEDGVCGRFGRRNRNGGSPLFRTRVELHRLRGLLGGSSDELLRSLGRALRKLSPSRKA